MIKRLTNSTKRPLAKKIKALKPQGFELRAIEKFNSFLRGNRILKSSGRLSIAHKEYLMIQEFALRELVEFRFAVFMLYHFGLRLSEIVCITNFNVKELVDSGTTVIISPLMRTARRLCTTQVVLKELRDFEAEIWDIFFNHRARKSRYIMADRKGNPFSPLDVAEVINEKLDEIVNYMDLEEECCWCVESLRGSNLAKELVCNNNFFARFEYENRWFYIDEDPEFDLSLESNYTITYYFARILEEDPYKHHSGSLVDRPYLRDNIRPRSAVLKKDKKTLALSRAFVESENAKPVDVYLEGCTLFTIDHGRVD